MVALLRLAWTTIDLPLTIDNLVLFITLPFDSEHGGLKFVMWCTSQSKWLSSDFLTLSAGGSVPQDNV
jgi:hypothetical protein